MSALHPYAASVLEDLTTRIPWEKEFLQAVEEVFSSISPVLKQNPQYKAERLLERLVEPERSISFRVAWTDDSHRVQVNRGYRVQFNSVLGPYKGGTRFHSSVTQGSLKFLGFEQTFKNSLTGLNLGGGKGGADFQFRGRSDGEIMRFCQAYMSELFRHIGPDTDVPAGDLGVGAREIGYLFGKYRQLSNTFNGTITGKGRKWGGSILRPEATGFGVTYFTEEMLKTRGENLAGKTVAISGFGNVAWGAVTKVTELGGKVVTISGPDGYVHIPDGMNAENIEYMLTMRASGRDRVEDFADKFGVEFFDGERPWVVPVNVAMPCAIQNELDKDDAESLIDNGCDCVVEGANMPTTAAAVDVFHDAGILFAPGKASNAGGVATSGLEMAQNRSGLAWTAERVDQELHHIMKNIHQICVDASAQFGHAGDYVMGANIGGFNRVAEAMVDQGIL